MIFATPRSMVSACRFGSYPRENQAFRPQKSAEIPLIPLEGRWIRSNPQDLLRRSNDWGGRMLAATLSAIAGPSEQRRSAQQIETVR
jgi:hypothetical protein